MSLAKKAAAEFIGAFWLVLGGCSDTGLDSERCPRF